MKLLEENKGEKKLFDIVLDCNFLDMTPNPKQQQQKQTRGTILKCPLSH